jgi:hypothetical protein
VVKAPDNTPADKDPVRDRAVQLLLGQLAYGPTLRAVA